MRIILISDWFAEKMGYAENCLPKAIAALGHEVHLITSNVQPYFNVPNYAETYAPFIGPGIVACETKPFEGYTLHRLPIAIVRGRLRIQDLIQRIRAIRPDIVQTFDAFSLTTYEAAWAKIWLKYKLFLESHIHASVFAPLLQPKRRSWKWRIYPHTVGRWVSTLSEKCYPVSPDAAKIAMDYLGIQESKIEVCSLGVDTDLFKPPDDPAAGQARQQLRERLGFSESEIVCIYTGRFADSKGPVLLARAIGELIDQGAPFRGLFVGSGTPAEIEAIESHPSCVVHPFVPVRDLPPFYWAADIGVWPKQESTSQLDAAACGLPIILSNRVEVRERIEGNGQIYQEGDARDLVRVIKTLADKDVRRRMGNIGTQKMREHFSWNRIAQQRVQDYAASLRAGTR